MLNSLTMKQIYSISKSAKKMLMEEKWYLHFFEGKDIRVLEIMSDEQREALKKTIEENVADAVKIMFINKFEPHTFPEHPEITFITEKQSPHTVKCKLN